MAAPKDTLEPRICRNQPTDASVRLSPKSFTTLKKEKRREEESGMIFYSRVSDSIRLTRSYSIVSFILML